MGREKRLIDANALYTEVTEKYHDISAGRYPFNIVAYDMAQLVKNTPTVDAVEVPDKKLLKAINLLIKQYERSKNSDYVHSPVAHAFYHTWKQLDDGRRE